MLYTSFYHSPVGVLRIKCDAIHLTALEFVEDEYQNTKDFEASPIRDNCRKQLDEYFKGSLQQFTIPLQQQGTDFQNRVWNKLCDIPYSDTITYLELAKRLGDPKCIRAAGTANGKNNIAIIVPCHRVIGSNNKLVGYAGGLWRKQWLLEHEAKFGKGALRLF